MAARRIHRRQRGAALLIFLILVVVGALSFLLSALTPEAMIARREQQTQAALAQAKEALIGYALTYRDKNPNEAFGYLPCPDFTGDGDADPNTGGRCNALDGQAEVGLFPYKTLGLSDLRDADGVCLWYAVSGNFKAATNKQIMNWDTQGQFSIVGTAIAPEQGDGGAAAVIFASSGPQGNQARTVGGQPPCNVDPGQVAAYLDGNYNFATAASIPITPGVVKNATGNITNNDRIAWVTPRDIFDRLKRRNDFSATINQLSTALVAAGSLTPTTPGASLPAPENATTVGSKKIGSFPAATPVSPATIESLQGNWRDMYRYVVCSPSTKCLTVNGTECMGALIFAGQRGTAGPRTTAEKGDHSTYLDAANYNAAYVSTTSPYALAGASSFTIADPLAAATQDVVYCLNSPPVVFTPTTISGTGAFASASASPLVASFASSGELGIVMAGSAMAGCAWYPSKIAFEKGIRVYFRFNIASRDSGFVVALADAGTNPATPGLCGGSAAYLGYADVGAGLTPGRIAPPKIGLEFDTRADSIPATDIQLSSYAGSSTLRHVGFDFWGALGTDSDDNTHRAGTLGSATEPQNPYVTGSGVRPWSLVTGTDYYVRLDIDRNYSAASQSGAYTMTAYLYTIGQFGLIPGMNCVINEFANLQDIPNCTPFISKAMTIADSVSGGNEALKDIYLGFTTGQRAARTQQITIHDFKAQNHQ